MLKKIQNYLVSDLAGPYFFFVGDDDYARAREELSRMGLETIYTSGFCAKDDKRPDLDRLFVALASPGDGGGAQKLLLLGLGEDLALRGREEATRILYRLKDKNLGGNKAILLLRGIPSFMEGITADPRLKTNRFHSTENTTCAVSITQAAPTIPLPGAQVGLRVLLSCLEKDLSINPVVNTAMDIDNSMFYVHKIKDAFEGITFILGSTGLSRSWGNEPHWAELLADINMYGGSLEAVFEKSGLRSDLRANLRACMDGKDYRNWVFFIVLKSRLTEKDNGYLRYVLDKTNNFLELPSMILNAIVEIPNTDKRYGVFYKDRAELLDLFTEIQMTEFVNYNKRKGTEAIHYLTDKSLAEKQEIIAMVTKYGDISEIESVYPDMYTYLKHYIFKCPELAELLTEYFHDYKKQKLSNTIWQEFLDKVDELALAPRPFNRLPTRNEVLGRFKQNGSFLYWLDALGVEYLSFIECAAQRRGLSVSIFIARSELPTTTAFNRDFYDSWSGDRKHRDKSLDNVKHKMDSGYDFTHNDKPIHLASELEIISSVIDRAAKELGKREHKRFLLVSDHGASRLAVLHRKEEKYETDSKGENSGRCCKAIPGQTHDLRFALEENGYLVLADYGRFKGSRAANVEVHGGASLEEVVIPIIELRLKDDSVKVSLVNDKVVFDTRQGAEIDLWVDGRPSVLSVAMGSKRYLGIKQDANLYKFMLTDVRRADTYRVDVYDGDNFICLLEVKAQGKSAKIDDAFDFLFQEKSDD